MKCPETRPKIFAFIDHELTPQEEQRLYKHLSTCQTCSQYLDMARNTDKLLRWSLNHAEPPDKFVEEVLQRLPGYEKALHKEKSISQTENSVPKEDNSRKGFFKGHIVGGILKRGLIAASIAFLVFTGGLSVLGYGDGLMGEGFFNIGLLPGDRESVSGSRSFNLGDLFNRRGVEKKQAVKNKKTGENSDKAAIKEETPEVNNNVEIALLDKEILENETSAETKMEPADSERELFSLKQSGEAETMRAAAQTVYLTPLVVDGYYNHVRPLWMGNNKIYYLSDKGGPGNNAFVAWEASWDGLSRRMLGSGSYSISLQHGGGVWSPGGKKIAFVTNKNGYWEIWSSDANGYETNLSLPEEGIIPSPGDLWAYNPTWSSKGELAFLTNRFGNTDIMVVDNNGSLRTITKSSAVEGNPVWSPDGNLIAYSSFKKGEGSRICVADKNGRNLRSVTPSIAGASMVSAWSPDGKKLSINVSGGKENNGLWMTTLEGKEWTQLSSLGGGKVVSWSSDGAKIAFTAGNGRLYVCQLPGTQGDKVDVVSVLPEDRGGIVKHVSWAPDSKGLILEWESSETKTSGIWRASLSKPKEE